MRFRVKDLKNYLPGKIDFKKVSKILTLKSFETVYYPDFLEVDILPNRYPDSASIVGLSKEIAVVLNKKFKEPSIRIKENSKKVEDYLKIIKQTGECSFYFGKVLLNIKNQDSPKWLKEFVNFYGFNSINFLVDLSNFVMVEYGAPLHLFDLDKIKGNVYVRIAKKGEKFISLENKVYFLEGSEIVIADNEKILALAGIKGSKTAEVTIETKNVLLEAAVFNAYKIYEISRKLRIKTEASFRFERRVSPFLSLKSLARLCQLIQNYLKAEVPKGILGYQKIEDKVLYFDFKKIEKFSGVVLKVKEFESILQLLSIKIVKKDKLGLYKLKIPPERLDIESEEDLVEEIIRIYGLNNISEKYEFSKKEVFVDKNLDFHSYLRRILISMGIDEGYNYNFCSFKDINYFNLKNDVDFIEVFNPLSENFKYFNFSLIPNLLKSVYLNQFNFSEIKLFQIDKTASFKNGKIIEGYKLAILYAYKDQQKILKYLKGILISLFDNLGVNFSLEENSFFKMFSLSAVIVSKEKLHFGIFGLISKDILKSYLIDLNVGVLEIDLEILSKKAKLAKRFMAWSTFPSIIRDLSFLLEEKITFKEIFENLLSLKIETLQQIKLIDVYFPKEANLKSFTLRLVFNHPQRNLKDEEVDNHLSKISDFLVKKFKVVLR